MYPNFNISVNKYCLCLAAVIFSLFPAIASAAEPTLYMPSMTIQAGQPFSLPVKIDHAEKLAGIKLVLVYDSERLLYEKADKTKITQGLMQVVNDKVPGKLVIVMAGARGISGKDIPLVSIHFRAAGLTQTVVSRIIIKDAELVGEDLKDIACRTVEGVVTISP